MPLPRRGILILAMEVLHSSLKILVGTVASADEGGRLRRHRRSRLHCNRLPHGFHRGLGLGNPVRESVDGSAAGAEDEAHKGGKVNAITRPESLSDVEERFRACVSTYPEADEEWRSALGWSRRRFGALLSGRKVGKTTGRLTARTLLRIDDLCDGHFLTPPERRWAERATRAADYKTRRLAPC